jgi:predicted NBD/HSP70 family sugar kinase
MTGSGVVLDLIRAGVTTRTGMLAHLGWSRVTLGKRLDELLAHGVIVIGGHEASGGGRPRESFAVNKDAGVLVALDIGSSHTRVGVTDLTSTLLVEDEADVGLFDGPDVIFGWAKQVFDYLLRSLGRSRTDVYGIGVGVPGPVDPGTGRLGNAQLDPRWDGLHVPTRVADWGRAGAVVAVDRDVNIMAVGEARLGWPEHHDLVMVKASIGVGCAFVLDGRLHRGSRGGAGLLSAPLRGRLSEPLQRLETVASGATVRDRLTTSGLRPHTSAEIVALVESGNEQAKALVDEVGATLGYALADVAALLNPAAVVIGGTLVELGEPFVATIRRSLFSVAHTYSRQGLIVEASRVGPKAGVLGASLVTQDLLFDAGRISELTHRTGGSRHTEGRSAQPPSH